VAVFGTPAVDGLGNAGGFKVMVRDRNDQGLEALQRAADELAEEGNKKKGLVGLIDSLRADTPQMFVEVDAPSARRWDRSQRCVSHVADLPGRVLRE